MEMTAVNATEKRCYTVKELQENLGIIIPYFQEKF